MDKANNSNKKNKPDTLYPNRTDEPVTSYPAKISRSYKELDLSLHGAESLTTSVAKHSLTQPSTHSFTGMVGSNTAINSLNDKNSRTNNFYQDQQVLQAWDQAGEQWQGQKPTDSKQASKDTMESKAAADKAKSKPPTSNNAASGQKPPAADLPIYNLINHPSATVKSPSKTATIASPEVQMDRSYYGQAKRSVDLVVTRYTDVRGTFFNNVTYARSCLDSASAVFWSLMFAGACLLNWRTSEFVVSHYLLPLLNYKFGQFLAVYTSWWFYKNVSTMISECIHGCKLNIVVIVGFLSILYYSYSMHFAKYTNLQTDNAEWVSSE